MKDIIDEFLEFINMIVRNLCIILAALMFLIVFLQVITRLLPVVKSPAWTEELSRYIMISFAFIGASAGIREWGMVGVDFIIERLPKLLKFGLNLLIRFIVLIFWCIVAYLGINILPKVGLRQYSPTMGFPIFYAQISVIIGAILCILQTIGQMMKVFVEGSEASD